LIHVLRDDSGEDSGANPLIELIILKLGVEDGLDVNEPSHKVLLVFEVLGQFDMNCTEEGLQNDVK